MEWLKVTIYTSSEGIEPLTGVLYQIGVTGVEIEDEADFYDMRNIGIGYTTITDEEIPVQVNVNLQEYTLERYLDDILVETRAYDTLEEWTERKEVTT